jgi:SHS2 domain-containing protein
MNGIERITKERKRQIEKEGWDAEHDAEHTEEELVYAAICYAAPEKVFILCEDDDGYHFVDPWPWDEEWDKRKKHKLIKRLTIAGALIAAEIDRLLAPQEQEDE